MITYVLILYLTTGWGTAATGGPTVIDGFTTLEKCEFANKVMKTKVQKYDWGQCIKVEK